MANDYLPKEYLASQGATLEEATASAERAVGLFVGLLRQLSAEQLQTPLGDGRWTPAEYADHVYRSMSFGCEIVTGVCGGAGPVESPRGTMLPDGRMVTMAEGQPVAGRPLAELERDLSASLAALIASCERARAQGLEDAEFWLHPFFGMLNLTEMMQMAAVHAVHHAKRHISPLVPADA